MEERAGLRKVGRVRATWCAACAAESIYLFGRCAWPGFCLGFEGYIENQGAGRAEKPWVDTETTRGAFQGREANLVGAVPGLTRLGEPYVEKAVELVEFTAVAIQGKFSISGRRCG
jgi:hypothetical protein